MISCLLIKSPHQSPASYQFLCDSSCVIISRRVSTRLASCASVPRVLPRVLRLRVVFAVQDRCSCSSRLSARCGEQSAPGRWVGWPLDFLMAALCCFEYESTRGSGRRESRRQSSGREQSGGSSGSQRWTKVVTARQLVESKIKTTESTVVTNDQSRTRV